MKQKPTASKPKYNSDYRKFLLFMIISIILIIAVIALSVFSLLNSSRLSNELQSLRGELAQKNEAIVGLQNVKAQLDSALAEISANKAEMEKYRKLITSLETTNAEQQELINSLTTPLNGRDEKTVEPTDKKIAYLTFDDGPSEHTEEILKILTEKNAVGTFFVKSNKDYMDKLPLIIEQGSAVAMHTYTHDFKSVYASVDAYFADLKQIEKLIFEKTGISPKLVRMPGGSSSSYAKSVVNDIIKRLGNEGYIYFDWNVDSRDASSDKDKSASKLISNVIDTVGDKRVVNILMHDTNDKKSTVEALPVIIDRLRADGYSFMTLNPTSTLTQHRTAK